MRRISLKKLPQITSDTVIGFLDETSPQTTANSQRLWSFGKPLITKNTTKIRANTFGFYALNGTSVVDFREHSRKEDVCAFLSRVRVENPGKRLMIVLDNFRSHHANETVAVALKESIDLVFLPPYSPDLNPIEYIWKSIKRIVSTTFIRDLDHIRELIETSFKKCAAHLGYARKWIEKFLEEEIKYKIIGF
jgi:putative transposase